MRSLVAALILTMPAVAEEPSRIVSVGGTVTEIVFALGEENRLVARDTTSTWPPQAEELPDVGYMRALSAEGLLSINPDLILIEDGAGPPETLDLLEAASVPMIAIPAATNGAGILARIDAVAAALHVQAKGEALKREVETDLAQAMALAMDTPAKRVLFVLSTQGGRIMASGEGTSAAAIIELAGGENAMTGFSGYKQVSDEAVLAAAPEVILMMDRTGDHALADDALFALPALVSSPAAKSRSVIRMDGLLMLGFGPRMPQAITALSDSLKEQSP